MALPLANSFEGGTNTTAISAANSGGASGDPVDSTVGTAPTFSTTHAAHGGMGMSCATASQSMVQWVASFGTPTEFWCRWYVWITGTVSAVLPICVARDATNAANASILRIGTTMIPSVVSNATATAFTSVVPAATWVRFEMHGLVGGGGTTVTTDANYFATMDAVTATESKTTAAIAQTTATFGAIRFGANLAQTQAIWMDDVEVNANGYPGPVTLPNGRRNIWLPSVRRAAYY